MLSQSTNGLITLTVEIVSNRATVLLQFMFGDTFTLFSVQVEQSMPGTSVEHEVVRLVQNESKLLQVVSHQ